jgi:hypothetical protein
MRGWPGRPGGAPVDTVGKFRISRHAGHGILHPSDLETTMRMHSLIIPILSLVCCGLTAEEVVVVEVPPDGRSARIEWYEHHPEARERWFQHHPEAREEWFDTHHEHRWEWFEDHPDARDRWFHDHPEQREDYHHWREHHSH